MFLLQTGHQPGVYVPLRALFLVVIETKLFNMVARLLHIFCLIRWRSKRVRRVLKKTLKSFLEFMFLVVVFESRVFFISCVFLSCVFLEFSIFSSYVFFFFFHKNNKHENA